MRCRVALALLLLPAAGCARCSASSNVVDSGPPPPPLMPSEALPPPAPWAFSALRRDTSVALPERCLPRGPTVRAPVAKGTHLVADPRALGALAIADTADRPPRLTGAGALTLEPEGVSHDPRPLPWFTPSSVPRIARLPDGTWLAGFDRPGLAGMSRVGLFHDGKAELLGEGDAFETVDIACAGDRCALLTSRIGRVAPAGAAVWLGAGGAPASQWRQVEIAPPESDARPFGIGAVDAKPGGGATVILTEKADAVFFEVGEGAPREVARLSAGHGLIDATALPTPVAMSYATPLDEDGCAQGSLDGGWAGLRIERAGLPGVELRAPAPPSGGALRRLEKGALAIWLAPLGCNQPRRVIYGVVLDAEGSPVGSPLPVADGTSFTVAAVGADVDLFLEDDKVVTWVRMRCSP